MASKKPKMTLKGELVSAPSWGFDYANTRHRITSKILSFEYEEYGQKYRPFEYVVDFEVKDDGAFDIPLRVSRNFMRAGQSGSKAEDHLKDLLLKLQNHCGIGGGEEPLDKKVDAKIKATMDGVIELAYFLGFKNESEE